MLQFVNRYQEQHAMNEQYEERVRNLEANTKKSEEEIKQLNELLNANKPQNTECNDMMVAAVIFVSSCLLNLQLDRNFALFCLIRMIDNINNPVWLSKYLAYSSIKSNMAQCHHICHK